MSIKLYKKLGKAMGIVAVDFDISDISKLISNFKNWKKGYVLLLSNNGTVVTNRDNYLIGEKIFGKHAKLKSLEPHTKKCYGFQ